MRIRIRGRVAIAGGLALTLAGTTLGAALAAPLADYQMPFSCTQEWYGSTRSYHSPSSRSVDLNRDGDLGMSVLAAASGVVSTATNLGNTSYGKYVKISHGNNEYTYYAHLGAYYVTAGQRVDKGQVIGAVGSSGGSTGPHLHFEERYGSTVVTAYFDGKVYTMPQTSRSRNCVNVPIAGDWNNDGRDDIGVFSRKWRGWFDQKLGTKVTRTKLGRGLDTPLTGDWDGDGTTDLGVFRVLYGQFLRRTSDGRVDRTIKLGQRGDLGLAGDWNKDGKTDVGVWRPAAGQFMLRYPSGTVKTIALGSRSTLPVTGDFNGDNRTDIGVYDPANARWTMRGVASRTGYWSASTTAGKPGALPVTGDFNGDSFTDLGTWNRKTGAYTLSLYNASKPRTLSRTYGAQAR